jgi:hypothetical protein
MLLIEYDSEGNKNFEFNSGMNGSLTEITAFEYDSLNREVKWYHVHSNMGYFVSERIYKDEKIYSYSYSPNTYNLYSCKRSILNEINSKQELIKMEGLVHLQKLQKHLTNISYLENNNVVKKVNFSNKGDTISIDSSSFNSNNKETSSHRINLKTSGWDSESFYVYDDSSNLVKWFNVKGKHNDTLNTFVYTYQNNQLKSKEVYHRKELRNRTTYGYNENGQVEKELFFELQEKDIKVKHHYKYDQCGNLRKEYIQDYRKPKNEQKTVIKTNFDYW